MIKTGKSTSWKRIKEKLDESNGVLLFAHRGCAQNAPENTMAAFSRVLTNGIPGVELDVQMCKTGELIVCHDFDLKRISGKPVKIEEVSYEEIKELDIGSWFSKEFKTERLPLLDEVFELLKDRVIYNIETKTDKAVTGPLEKKLLEALEKHNLKRHVIISSFNPFSIKAVHKLDPTLPISLIYSRSKRLPFILRHGEGRLFTKELFIQVYYKLLNPITSFFHRGIFGNPIIAWTVDNPLEAKRLLKLGVKGIISNNPPIIKETILKEGKKIIQPEEFKQILEDS